MDKVKITVEFTDSDEITILPFMNKILQYVTIPKTAKKIIFNDEFNECIPPNFIPDTAVEIDFGENFNQKLEIGIIPEGVTKIIFGKSYNKPLEKGVFPKNLQVLIIDSVIYNHSFSDDVIPDTVSVFRHRILRSMGKISAKATELVIASDCHVYIPSTVKIIYIYHRVNSRCIDMLYDRNVPDAKYFMFCENICEKPSHMPGKYHLSDEIMPPYMNDDDNKYYVLTFDNEKIRIELEKLRQKLADKNFIENENKDLKNELLKNREMCEKMRNIIKLFKEYTPDNIF